MVKFNSLRFMLKVSFGFCFGEFWIIRSRKRMLYDFFGFGIDQFYCVIFCDFIYVVVMSFLKFFILQCNKRFWEICYCSMCGIIENGIIGLVDFRFKEVM